MSDIQQRQIELHYEFYSQKCHYMDALAFNRAEYNLILAIQSLSDYINCQLKINIEAKNEGGIIDTLQVILSDPNITHVFDLLLGGLIANWFRPKINKTEEIKNRVEIIDKIKSGNFKPEEVGYLLSGDKNLRKWCSNYYKTISDTNEVSQITATASSFDDVICSETLTKNDFSEKVINTEEATETKIIEGTTIHIVSPILVKTKPNQSWQGIYSGEPIDFIVEDNDFLEQVYNHEIKFGNGTYITCSLSITTLTKIKDDGEKEIKQTYIVKEVYQWADDDTFQYHTKRYKRKRSQQSNPKQLTLDFGDTEILTDNS